ncbi:hypothetical protein V1477_019410 [Vespula maculifrons]|uniref:Uncharacterized protein n=1 Tax=Vespula maculifrons TaxID=7453 RepID=A0ABD2ASF6_VESMC
MSVSTKLEILDESLHSFLDAILELQLVTILISRKISMIITNTLGKALDKVSMDIACPLPTAAI